MTGHRPPRRARGFARPGALALLGILSLAAFLGGFAAASLSVNLGGPEQGAGNANSAAALTWWVLKTAAPDVIPGSLPPSASSAPGSPSVLPTVNGSFTMGIAQSSHGALRLDFQEKGAPTATEFEVAVTFQNASGVFTSSTVYLETQNTTVGGTLQFSLYLDTGTGTPVFLRLTELIQQCVAISNCP